MIPFSELWQAWCEVETATGKIPIPVYAKPQSLRIDGAFIWLELGKCPEASAVMQGCMFSDGGPFTGNFECALTSTSGVLKTASGSGGYSIDEDDLKTCLFSAYYCPSPDSQEAVTVSVVDELSGPCQIMIFAGGRVAASQDLVGKTIKVAATWTKTILMSQDKVQSIYLHLVGESPEGKTLYAGYSGCKIEPVAGLLKVELGAIDKLHEVMDTKAS